MIVDRTTDEKSVSYIQTIRDLLTLARRMARTDSAEKRREMLTHAIRIAGNAGVHPNILRDVQ